MALDKAGLTSALAASFKKIQESNDQSADEAAASMADAIDAYVKTALATVNIPAGTVVIAAAAIAVPVLNPVPIPLTGGPATVPPRGAVLMPTGLAMPVGVGQSGGARLSEGDENDDKIMRLALGDDANENAFQQNVGVGADMVFGQADELLRATIMRRLQDVFRRFEAQKRYVLSRNSIRWSQDSKTQEMILEFRYVSTESDRELDFREAFSVSSNQ